MMTQSEERLFVCDLRAIPAEARERHLAAIPGIFRAARDARELDNGFAFKFDDEPGRFRSLADFIEYERLCCPFEGFVLEVEPYGKAIWLRLTGGEGYKEVFRAGLQDLRGAAEDIQRGPDDDEAVGVLVDEAAETMAALMDRAGGGLD